MSAAQCIIILSHTGKVGFESMGNYVLWMGQRQKRDSIFVAKPQWKFKSMWRGSLWIHLHLIFPTSLPPLPTCKTSLRFCAKISKPSSSICQPLKTQIRQRGSSRRAYAWYSKFADTNEAQVWSKPGWETPGNSLQIPLKHPRVLWD